MFKLSSEEVDLGITELELKLSASSGISTLYPNQRQLLHEFCKGQSIFYTGNLYILLKHLFDEPNFKSVQMLGRRSHHVSTLI